jgi:DNA-binding transcriptional MerR regulator
MGNNIMKDYFTIGEISKLFKVSIKTLRHYDKIGLLKPEYINKETNYRYYSVTQIMLLYIIKELKYQGFSLSDIDFFLKNEDISQTSGLYTRKIIEIENEIAELKKTKDRLIQKTKRLDYMKLLDEEHLYDTPIIKIKELEKRKVISSRQRYPFNFVSVTLKTIELFNEFHSNNLHMIDPYVIIFHEDYKEFNSISTDFEICAGIDEQSIKEFKQKCQDKELSKLKTLNGGTFATAISRGSYEKSIKVYNSLIDYIEKEGYVKTGPLYKVYITNFALTKATSNLIYELQIPVKKA